MQKSKILCDGRLVAVNSNIKYLGLWIDDNLNFDIHLIFLECKIAYAMCILNKLKYYFHRKILLQFYQNVLIYLHLLYAIPVWGSTNKSYLHNISILQNKAVKFVTQAKWNSSTNPSYTNLKVLKLN